MLNEAIETKKNNGTYIGRSLVIATAAKAAITNVKTFTSLLRVPLVVSAEVKVNIKKQLSQNASCLEIFLPESS